MALPMLQHGTRAWRPKLHHRFLSLVHHVRGPPEHVNGGGLQRAVFEKREDARISGWGAAIEQHDASPTWIMGSEVITFCQRSEDRGKRGIANSKALSAL
jgi:hypothetical protein